MQPSSSQLSSDNLNFAHDTTKISLRLFIFSICIDTKFSKNLNHPVLIPEKIRQAAFLEPALGVSYKDKVGECFCYVSPDIDSEHWLIT